MLLSDKVVACHSSLFSVAKTDADASIKSNKQYLFMAFSNNVWIFQSAILRQVVKNRHSSGYCPQSAA
jgi:hypothetical protein